MAKIETTKAYYVGTNINKVDSFHRTETEAKKNTDKGFYKVYKYKGKLGVPWVSSWKNQGSQRARDFKMTESELIKKLKSGWKISHEFIGTRNSGHGIDVVYKFPAKKPGNTIQIRSTLLKKLKDKGVIKHIYGTPNYVLVKNKRK